MIPEQRLHKLQQAEPVVEPAVQHPVVPVEPEVHQKSKQIVKF